MDLSGLYTLISSTYPTAYWAFPEGDAQDMPFVTIFESGTDNFGADNKVFYVKKEIAVELYTRTKSPTDEAALEGIFDANDLFWNKEETHLDDENAYEVIYSLEVI